MDVNCERLILSEDNDHSHSRGGGRVDMPRIQHDNSVVRAERGRRWSAAAAAAQRTQNSTDTGGGVQKLRAADEIALAMEIEAEGPSVCIICRERVEECCTLCCRNYSPTTIADFISKNSHSRHTAIAAPTITSATACDAKPKSVDQPQILRDGIRTEGCRHRSITLPAATAPTAQLSNSDENGPIPLDRQSEQTKDAAAVSAFQCCHCRRQQRRACTKMVKQSSKASTAPVTAMTTPVEAAHLTKATTKSPPCSRSSHAPPMLNLTTTTNSDLTTTSSALTSPPSSLASSLALTTCTNYIEPHQSLVVASTTATTTTVNSPTVFEKALSTFQFLLLCIQVQLLHPLYGKIHRFLYKNNSNSNKNNKQYTTNSNSSNRNSKNRNTSTKSNKRHENKKPQLQLPVWQEQPQQQQQRPPLLRLMQQVRCNSYYNNNNNHNKNNLLMNIVNSNSNYANIYNTSQMEQQQHANANANKNSCNNRYLSNDICSQPHHINYRTVQQKSQILQQHVHHHNFILPSPTSAPTTQPPPSPSPSLSIIAATSSTPTSHRQSDLQQRSRHKTSKTASLQLQLQHLRHFKMPNLTYLYKLLLILSFLSLFLPSINAQTPHAIATSSASSTPNRNAIRTAPVSLRRNETVCRSLDIRNSASELKQLRNCTVIEGFLLITLINQRNPQEFTQTFPLLTEVTEFIIIYRVHKLRSLSQIFPNLSVIRGTTLFEGYALIVYYNPHLEDLGLSKLTTIVRGGVRIENNIVLCYVETIAWKRIVNSDGEITIENNSKSIECPKCPGDAKAGTEEGMGTEVACKEFDGQRRCWSNNKCQKICPDRCKNNCVDENTCCNENCIGGCSPKNLDECISCRDFSIYNSTCIEKCPPNFFSFLDRRCITAEDCIGIGTKFENNKQQIVVPYEGKCTTRCPNGYNKIGTTCQACGDDCIKRCHGAHIDSVERAKDFTGCTHIVNSGLTISIRRGGKHLMEELETGLSSIQEISTYLKIQGTYGLTSLSFFKRLKRINGTQLMENKFAIYALENNDLESVWGDNRTVHIERGRVFFHFNPKLCYNEIEKLLPMMKENATFDKNEVATDSNGHKGSCNTELLNVTMIGIASRVAIVEILNPLIFIDNRTFIGYQYFIMEDKYKNATKYSQSVCDDSWIVSDPTKENKFIFSKLQPYTQYAYYVKTWTISSEKRNAQSNIHHFKTKSAQPNVVQSLNAYAISSSEIAITWTAPANPQGNLTVYRVHATLDKRSQVLDTRNYCKDPAQIDKDDDSKDPTRDNPGGVTEAPNAANCKCDGEKSPSRSDIDTSEATIVAGIDFENTMQNFIYVKRTNVTKKPKAKSYEQNKVSPNETDAKRHRRRSEGNPEDSFLVRHMRAVPDNFENIILKTTSEDVDVEGATIITTVSPIEIAALASKNASGNGDLHMDPTGQFYENFVRNVSVTTNKYVFQNLKHFSFYTIGVEACRQREVGAKEKECSEIRTRFVRTKKMEGVDKVENLRVNLVQTNTSRSEVRINWDPPTNPNGDVVSYTISYKKSEQDAVEEKRCITEENYRNLTHGYTMPLPTGNYSIRVRANSLAGDGVYSEIVYIDIPPEKWSGALIAGICIAVISIVLLMVGVYWYVRRKYTPPEDIKIIPTVNPYYISLQYVQDGWEVERDRVLQLSPLGQGSFGMVYEGILKGLNETDDTPCAIKTVNENATDRERINFLSEASVMKQFDTYHVVRLLGVCSIGQPALVVMELMKYGDLKSYLRAHRPDNVQNEEKPFRYRDTKVQPPPLSHVFRMAIEIGDGMAYLSAKKFVHRDLAARNCMVGENLTVKIGDFGMTRDIYETDYYRKGDKGLLPVRWMPPESLRDGIYSTASDVFSYGVVLWEIVTLASQPYPGYSNDQVLRFVIEGGVMERPDNCPDEIYAIMQQSWEHRPSKRPSFFKIIRTLLEHMQTDTEEYLSRFREVSYYFSNEGTQEREKERAESMHPSGNIFSEENEIDDATTPLRTDEFNEYKLKLANTSSVERDGERPMAIDDDHPHSPYSSTPDGHSKNSYNFSQMSHNNQTLLSSLPSTSAGIVSGGSHSQSHQLHQPGSQLRKPRFSQFPTEESTANYVLPDYDPRPASDGKKDRQIIVTSAKIETDERGYEIYDPSPNDREHEHDEDDFDGVPTTSRNSRIGSGAQQLLPRNKPRQRIPTIMPMSSSMPDEITDAPISSSLHPSTASAASSNASSTNTTTGRYLGLKAVADKMRFKNINRRIFNHKRTGSNASHRSTSSNPNTTTSSSSNSNIAAGVSVGHEKSTSGQNLGTIESGGSGSPSSYVTPRFFTRSSDVKPSNNPNYRLLDETANTSCLTDRDNTSDFSGNRNYKRLDESLNSTLTPGKPTSSNTAPSSNVTSFPPRPFVQSIDNASYTLMRPAASGSTLRTTDNPNYVVMNQPAGLTIASAELPQTATTSPIAFTQRSDDATYTMMGPAPYHPGNRGSSTSSLGGNVQDVDDDNDDDNDEDNEGDEPTDCIKMELLGEHRRDNEKAQQHRKSRGKRSRSQSQNKFEEKPTSKSGSSAGATPASGFTDTTEGGSRYVTLTPITTTVTTTHSPPATQYQPSATYSLKEKWLRQQSQQPQQPPPNGFIGRET